MSDSAESRVRQLEDAFNVFTQMSSQLETSYRALEDRVAELNEELAAARSERLLQLAEKERIANRLQRLLELLPGGVLVLDAEGIITASNPAACELLNEPLEGQFWRQVIDREFSPGDDESSEVTLKSGRRVSISTRSLKPESGMIVLLMDVSEQYALQTMLNRHQRLSAMGEMAASLAHQVRTPLSSALLYLSNIQAHAMDAEQQHRYIDKAMKRLRHLEGMVGDMLQYARGGSFDMEELPLNEVLEQIEQTLNPQISERNGSMHIDNAAGVRIRGNRDALVSALLNIGANALDAVSGKPRISVGVRRTGQGFVEIVFNDNGPGVDDETRERMFTPFFTTKSDGTGLGLAIVKAIVVAHQGNLEVASENENGTTFVIRLPEAGHADALASGARVA